MCVRSSVLFAFSLFPSLLDPPDLVLFRLLFTPTFVVASAMQTVSSSLPCLEHSFSAELAARFLCPFPLYRVCAPLNQLCRTPSLSKLLLCLLLANKQTVISSRAF